MTHQTPEPNICGRHSCMISEATHNTSTAAQLQTASFDQGSCSFTLQVQPKAAETSYYGIVIIIASEEPGNCTKTAKKIQSISAKMRRRRHRLWYFCQSLCWQFQIHHNASILLMVQKSRTTGMYKTL